jgi:hypothetical protein
MKLRKLVFVALVFSMMIAGSALADLQCCQGIGVYDPWGSWSCTYTSMGGNCLWCYESIDVKG